MSGEVLLSCTDVCKNFGATRALVNVSFELKRGEVCGLIGENGSGKSTLSGFFASRTAVPLMNQLLRGWHGVFNVMAIANGLALAAWLCIGLKDAPQQHGP